MSVEHYMLITINLIWGYCCRRKWTIINVNKKNWSSLSCSIIVGISHVFFQRVLICICLLWSWALKKTILWNLFGPLTCLFSVKYSYNRQVIYVFATKKLLICCCFCSSNVHPVVVAAHPSEANQFALGLTDGTVYVMEPLESDRKWGNPPPVENGSTSNLSTPPNGASSSDQPER
jgi:hypothetical protein